MGVRLEKFVGSMLVSCMQSKAGIFCFSVLHFVMVTMIFTWLLHLPAESPVVVGRCNVGFCIY